MNRTAVLKELKDAYAEIRELISDSTERGQFNSLYFEPKFKEWYAEKLDLNKIA